MSHLSEISVLILCGGVGSRLRPVVSDRQKVLAEVSGRPFITFILDQISDAGGRNVILCTGFMGEQIEGELGNRYKALSLCYSREDEPLGTAGAIRNAFDMITSDVSMVYNGDSYCRINPEDLLEWHILRKSTCTLTLVNVPDVERYGSVNFDSDYIITSFDEKRRIGKNGWVNAGIYCIDSRLIASIREKENISLEKDFFPDMIGKRLFAFPQNAEFIDIGTPDSYREANPFFKER